MIESMCAIIVLISIVYYREFLLFTTQLNCILHCQKLSYSIRESKIKHIHLKYLLCGKTYYSYFILYTQRNSFRWHIDFVFACYCHLLRSGRSACIGKKATTKKKQFTLNSTYYLLNCQQ